MKQGIIIAGFTALGKTTLAQKYDIVLTSMHWKLLEYFNKNNISFYLAYPKLDSGDVLKQRCIDRGNTEEWAQAIKDKVNLWYPRIREYNIKNVIFIDKNECLEDALIKMNLIKE
jgi:hypothetical protein